jgi:threonyl-tRNA synthetase
MRELVNCTPCLNLFSCASFFFFAPLSQFSFSRLQKTLDKKILEHSLYNYILVVGATEEQNKTVNVRKRKEGDAEQVGRDREVPLHEFIQEMSDLMKKYL